METKQQIDHLIELAIVQRAELKRLVDQLPVLRQFLLEQINGTIEDMEPQLRSDLIEFCDEKTDGKIREIHSYFDAAKSDFKAKSTEFFAALEKAAQVRFEELQREKQIALNFAEDARANLAVAAQQEAAKIPAQVSELVQQELARFPRAGEIDQLRKEFSEPRGLNPRGKWKPSETYQRLDLVAYNGDSFVSSIDDNREKPSRSSAAWTLSAARGQGSGGGGISSLNDILGAPTSDLNVVGAEGSNYVRKTLTAGTNITLSETPTAITIDAAGGSSVEIVTASVVNAESIAITRGQVVYAYQATGNKVSVKLASNFSESTSSKTFGVVSDDSIAAGAVGTVTCIGVVDKLNTGSYTEGATAYLGATAGTITTTKPYAPNHLVYVGVIARANNGNGELYVKIQNGYELDEIHDVQITAPKLAGQTIFYDATNSLWKNANIAGTTNQITVTNADAAVTLSLPQQLAISGQSLTGSSATSLLDLSTTWNTTGNPTALKLNVTNTASGASSNLLDLQVGGTSRFKVAKDGATTVSSTTASTSSTTGALIVSGGIGAAGKLNLADHTTNAGGIGLGSDINIYRANQGVAFFETTVNNVCAFRLNNISASPSCGYEFWLNSSQRGSIYYTSSSNTLRLWNNGDFLAGTTSTVSILPTTDSTSTTTGALVVSGGLGVAKAATIGGSIKSTSATGGIGYATGAGGAVTQATSRTTGVTLNTVSGAITLASEAGSTTWQTFTVTNSAVAATDVVKVCQKSGADLYQLLVTNVSAGLFKISLATTGGTTTEQPVINFAVIKAVTS